MSEIITVIAKLSAFTFIITSMLAMGLSLTVKQIMDPLKNTRLVLLALLANFVLVPALAYLITVVIPLDDGLATGLGGDARALIERLGVAMDVSRPASGLTLAEQQTVEIARALSVEPDLIVAQGAEIRFDLGYGGAFYACVDAATLGIDTGPDNSAALASATATV